MRINSISGYLMVLFLFTSVHANGQERFESWLNSDQFLLSRPDGTHEKQFVVSLPYGKQKEWNGEQKRVTYTQSSLSIDDGTIIQLQKNDLYIIKSDATEVQLTNDVEEEKNATLSADKTKIAYTKNHDLYVYDLSLKQEIRLTEDGSETIYNGWASWVYYEEILGRSSHYAAFWWSPDSKRIAFLHFDDQPVPTFPIFNSEGQHGSLEINHYPKAGDPNPKVQFAIADVVSGEIIWVNENQAKDQYSALPFWTPNGEFLFIQELNRSQDTLHLVRINPIDGSRKLIYEETQATWVEFFEEIDFINNREFIFRSNKRGWYNLYRYDIDGNLLAELTPVEWRVTEVDHIDETGGWVYFYGTGEESTDRHFFRVDLDGKNLKKITTDPGWHTIDPAPEYRFFVDRFSSLTMPGKQLIIDADGEVLYTLSGDNEDQNRRAGVRVEPLSIRTDDGFNLPGFWVLPKEFDREKKYPVVFDVYGGPDAGNVRNRYRDYSGDYYTNHDIIRISVDHRGSGKFGKKGMDFMHRNLGKWEIDDLISAVKWLRTLPFIDSTKVAITGGSYGGYVTLMALTYGAEYFTHGISLFPVTDWQLYDNVYTERYMDTPLENIEGYKFGSAIEQAYKLKGKLLIVHGMMDDNVHMQNTVQLISKLQDLGKDFDLMMYPGERHGWGGAKRSHLSKLINNFWSENLLSTSSDPAKISQP